MVFGLSYEVTDIETVEFEVLRRNNQYEISELEVLLYQYYIESTFALCSSCRSQVHSLLMWLMSHNYYNWIVVYLWAALLGLMESNDCKWLRLGLFSYHITGNAYPGRLVQEIFIFVALYFAQVVINEEIFEYYDISVC